MQKEKIKRNNEKQLREENYGIQPRWQNQKTYRTMSCVQNCPTSLGCDPADTKPKNHKVSLPMPGHNLPRPPLVFAKLAMHHRVDTNSNSLVV